MRAAQIYILNVTLVMDALSLRPVGCYYNLGWMRLLVTPLWSIRKWRVNLNLAI